MRPPWQPSPARIAESNIQAFIARVKNDWGTELADYRALWRWSVEHSDKFWTSLWDFAGIIAETRGERVVADGDAMPGARFFPDAKLNFAENLLRRDDASEAMVFWGEDRVRKRVSHRELNQLVSRLQQAMQAAGIGPGDRVAAYLPNLPETIACMLAASSLGAIWSSGSPDFGVRGLLDRFGQIEPKILIAADGYFYNGKTHDTLARLPDILAGLPSVEATVVIPYVTEAPDLSPITGAVTLDDYLAPYEAKPVEYTRLPFNHPLYILFSSGTTGAPKCIVHGAGGTLLQHIKEHRLHCDIHEDDRVFYFTTCGWMMWNWLASVLASEAVLLLYDGSPGYPDANLMFDFADHEAMTLLGTSAKFIDTLRKQALEPGESHDLSSLRTICSTGSPLAPESFDYIYNTVAADISLVSMSGGTDIIACFMGGDPTGPVWRGEIQAPALGMDVCIYDDEGNRLVGEKGELVCANAFPSMPVGFWRDPEDARYRAAYFEKFPGVWCHGDYVEETTHGGYVIHGRSDAVLNPGGVRIGTAEIYRQVEQLDEVLEAIVIGQDWDNDVRVVLFVRLRDALALDDGLIDKIKLQVRANCTPRHVPARVIQVADIPRTKSGKIVELAVRDVVHGRAVKNLDALANPEALDLFADRAELQA